MRLFMYTCATVISICAIAAPPLVLLALYVWSIVLRWDARQSQLAARERQRIERLRRKRDKEWIAACRGLR